VHGNGYSHARYGAGGMLADFVPHRCGFELAIPRRFSIVAAVASRQALLTPRGIRRAL
jgi:hypothetical protein